MMCLEEDEMFGCCFLGEGGGSALPSSLEARNWATSLDKLLLSSYGTALFRAFLQKEYAEENLDFVLKVERYRESGPKKRERDAWKIYRTYIAIGAPHELNLDILSRKVRFVPHSFLPCCASGYRSARIRTFLLDLLGFGSVLT